MPSLHQNVCHETHRYVDDLFTANNPLLHELTCKDPDFRWAGISDIYPCDSLELKLAGHGNSVDFMDITIKAAAEFRATGVVVKAVTHLFDKKTYSRFL